MYDEKIRKRPIPTGCTVAVVLLCSISLLLAASPLSGCKSSPRSPESEAAPTGEGASGGEERFSALFQEDPESYRVLRSVQEDYRASRFDDAVSKLETLLKESPNAPWAEVVLLQLVQALRVQGRSRHALPYLDLFLERYPASPEAPNALLYLGEIHLRLGTEGKGSGGENPMSRIHLDRALGVFQEIQKKYPERRELVAQAVLYSGSTYEEIGDSEQAAGLFRRVADEFSDTQIAPRSLYALAGVLLREGDVAAAQRAFGEITDLYPGSSEARRAGARLQELGLVGHDAAPLEIREWIGEVHEGLEALRGKATLIYFWAIWCPYCKQSIPRIHDMIRAHAGRDLNVVGVSRERPGFETEQIREYVRTSPMLFPTGIDDGARTSSAYAVTGIPRVVLVDAWGKVRWHGHPDHLSGKVLEKVLEGPSGS